MSSMSVGELNTFNRWLIARGLRPQIDALRIVGKMDEMTALANQFAAEFKRLGGNAYYIPRATR